MSCLSCIPSVHSTPSSVIEQVNDDFLISRPLGSAVTRNVTTTSIMSACHGRLLWLFPPAGDNGGMHGQPMGHGDRTGWFSLARHRQLSGSTLSYRITQSLGKVPVGRVVLLLCGWPAVPVLSISVYQSVYVSDGLSRSGNPIFLKRSPDSEKTSEGRRTRGRRHRASTVKAYWSSVVQLPVGKIYIGQCEFSARWWKVLEQSFKTAQLSFTVNTHTHTHAHSYTCPGCNHHQKLSSPGPQEADWWNITGVNVLIKAGRHGSLAACKRIKLLYTCPNVAEAKIG